MRVAFGGPLWGYFMGKLTILWLVNIFNDALTEITITLASTYVTFYIGMLLGANLKFIEIILDMFVLLNIYHENMQNTDISTLRKKGVLVPFSIL